jgi:putative transposase
MVAVMARQAYRFALDPTPAQERLLCSHAGAARFAWNWGLARCRERYAVEGRWYSGVDLHKLWNAAKKADPALAWWGENSKCVYQEAFRDLDRALRDFTKSKKGQRKGRRLGFPRFKRRGRCREAFRLTGVICCASATVRPGSSIGIDLGVSTLLTGVDDSGNVITVVGPKALRTSLRRLRRASRAHSRKAPGSVNRRKSAARLARIHAKAANARTDALHQATTELARRYETVIAEDLNVAGMIRNRHLARAITDQGLGTARRMLAYKTTWNGGRLIIAGRWFPSSKACSGCGAAKAKLALSERTYRCDRCDLVMDREVNAASNLLHLAASGAGSINACGGTIRPGPAGHVPVKQEPGAARAGKTGTASGQPLAAGRELTHAH